ncbi:MAG: hypothetical protein ACRDZ7_07080 [Acidimicrobiia bacterium]
MGARRRWRWAGLAGAALVAFGFASAAKLTVGDGSIAAGKGAPGACDADGVTAYQVVSGTSVSAVELGGVDAACAGGTVRVTVHNGGPDPAREGTATIPAGGGTVTVTLASAVPLKDSHMIGIFLQAP